MKNIKKWLRWTPIYSLLLVGYVTFTLLDAFVIPHDTVKLSELESAATDAVSAEEVSSDTKDDTASETGHKRGQGSSVVHAEGSSGKTHKKGEKPSGRPGKRHGDSESDGSHGKSSSDTSTEENTTSEATTPTAGSDTYSADGINITLTTKYVNDTWVYIADVELSDTSALKSGLAEDSFGRNISEKTSEIASRLNAVLAINGDYYGFRDTGYVIRNGYLYRSKTADEDQEDLVIYKDGTFEIIKESEITAEELLEKGALQVYSFGPALVEDGKVSVTAGDEVDQSMSSNPRTAIGMVEAGHYVFVVSDGRTSESEGLSLAQLAEVMKDAGCTTAYNLDGGGSTTMYFKGEVVNNPTTNGNKISERSVSDIVYIG
ncbi:MAG: phosphodiester glycosidase family protein [Lachnospiraceae bacterium]|nr:phosphodiester glycosidase family protein [Lachnospiraceae bacterium]